MNTWHFLIITSVIMLFTTAIETEGFFQALAMALFAAINRWVASFCWYENRLWTRTQSTDDRTNRCGCLPDAHSPWSICHYRIGLHWLYGRNPIPPQENLVGSLQCSSVKGALCNVRPGLTPLLRVNGCRQIKAGEFECRFLKGEIRIMSQRGHPVLKLSISKKFSRWSMVDFPEWRPRGKGACREETTDLCESMGRPPGEWTRLFKSWREKGGCWTEGGAGERDKRLPE